MAKTKWTQNRLTNLFRRYNKNYWNSSLDSWIVGVKKLQDFVGICCRKEKEIWIDIAAHKTDLEVRETLLHEMAHAADKSKSKIAHGYGFWEQIERLLEQGAPLNVSFSEMPSHTFPLSAIPKKFKRCRAVAEKLEKTRERETSRIICQERLMVREISDEDILEEFADYEAGQVVWQVALRKIGLDYGLVDVEGRPVDERAERIIKKGYQKHKYVRSLVLKENRLMASRCAERDQVLDNGATESKPMSEIE